MSGGAEGVRIQSEKQLCYIKNTSDKICKHIWYSMINN